MESYTYSTLCKPSSLISALRTMNKSLAAAEFEADIMSYLLTIKSPAAIHKKQLLHNNH